MGAAFLGPPGLGGDNLGLSNALPNQSFLTGGGTGVPTVAIETSPEIRDKTRNNQLINGIRKCNEHCRHSPIIRRDSLHAWYIFNMPSRLAASSGLSSIIDA